MGILASGHIAKMRSFLQHPVHYHLPVGDDVIDMNALLGENITLQFNGHINCQYCGRRTKKSYAQGYCYPCMITLAQCDSCIMSPEKCHYALGTCREPEWAESHCMIDHIVYLANSSGIKVGITRHSQIPTRWIDQGAISALPIFRASSRKISGLVEVAFKTHVADKTDWRKMLRNDMIDIDLPAERDKLFSLTKDAIAAITSEHGIQSVQLVTDSELTEIQYPVIQYPSKVSSLCFDKTPVITGKLMGIKGQYILLDGGVLNMRKYTSYHLDVFVN